MSNLKKDIERVLRSEFYVNDDALTIITFRQGYNRAILEMRAKLKGDSDE